MSGGIEPRFLPWTSETDPPGPQVTMIVYNDLPEPGMLTAISYGLSLSSHPEWRFGRPELAICVRSTDDRWAWAAALLIDRLRDRCPFCFGDTIPFYEPVTNEGALDSFVVFACPVLDHDDACGIDLGDELPVNIVGLYPIHSAEGEWIREHGLEAFWRLGWDGYDVRRESALPTPEGV